MGATIPSTPLVNTGTEVVVAVEVVGSGVTVGPTEVVMVVVPFPEGMVTATVEVVEVTVMVDVVDPVVEVVVFVGGVMKGGYGGR